MELNAWVVHFIGRDGQQPNGVIASQQTGQLHQPYTGGSGAWGGRWGGQEENS